MIKPEKKKLSKKKKKEYGKAKKDEESGLNDPV